MTGTPILGARSERWRRLNPEVRGRILLVLMIHRNRLAPKTLGNYGDALVRLASVGDLDNVAVMEKVISGLKGNRLGVSSAAYRLYCRVHRLPEPTYTASFDHRRPLPRIPAERTLQASLAIPRTPTWRTYFRLLYETGARPGGPFSLRVQNLVGMS